MRKPRDIYDSVVWMFILSKLFGYTSFSIKKNKFVFSKLGTIYPAFICFVYVSFSAFDIYTRGQQDRSEIYHIIELVNVHSFSGTTILIMFFGIYYQRQMLKLLEAIHLFDKQIIKNKSMSSLESSYYKTKKHIIIALVVFHFFSCSLLVEDIICFFPRTIKFISFKFIFTYCVPLFACNTFILELNILVLLITNRYKWINKELKKLKLKFDYCLKSTNLNKLYSIGYGYNDKNRLERELIKDLEALRKYYSILHSITQQLNSIYSLRITIQVYQIFVSLITNILFFVKQRDSANDRKQSISYILIMIEVMSMNVFEVASLCYYSTKLCDEAYKTPLIVHSFQKSEIFDEYIVSQATSYLIICVQLDIPDKQVV